MFELCYVTSIYTIDLTISFAMIVSFLKEVSQ